MHCRADDYILDLIHKTLRAPTRPQRPRITTPKPLLPLARHTAIDEIPPRPRHRAETNQPPPNSACFPPGRQQCIRASQQPSRLPHRPIRHENQALKIGCRPTTRPQQYLGRQSLQRRKPQPPAPVRFQQQMHATQAKSAFRVKKQHRFSGIHAVSLSRN